MLDDTFFCDEKLKFWVVGPPISEPQINSVISHSFNGKNDFVDFYVRHNGGSFKHGAYFYRDNFYSVTPEDHNSMAIDSFFFIPRHPGEKAPGLQSIAKARELVAFHYSSYEAIKKFAEMNFPFAGDPSGNDYWIEIPTGCVRCIMWESFQDGPVELAPSFSDFVCNLVSERRKPSF